MQKINSKSGEVSISCRVLVDPKTASKRLFFVAFSNKSRLSPAVVVNVFL